MTQSLALGDVQDDTLDVAGRRRVTATLCLTQITGWGVLFYAFPVLAPSIARDTGWSVSGSAAAFGAGQLTAAAVGIWVGRHLDRRGPRQLMTTGSVLATLALAVLAAAPSLVWFLLGWVLGGVAMAMALYQPAFAAITRWHDDHDRLRALTILTVAGGLASTVFAPLTAVLASTVGWRSTYLILAAGLATITIPAHFWGLRGSWPAAPRALDQVDVRPGAIATSRAFVALTVALTLSALSASAVVVNLVPLLDERGIGLTTAGLILGLGGVGQVAGRLGFGLLHRRLPVVAATASIMAVLAATTTLFGLLESLIPIVAVALLAGAGRGIFTLLKATAVTSRWGVAHYGSLTGLLAAPVTVAAAAAPWAGAQLADLVGSYATAFLILGAVNAVAVAVSLTTQPAKERVPT